MIHGKKFASFFIAALMGISILTGCGNSNSEDVSSNTDQSQVITDTGDRSKVMIWDYMETDAQREMLTELLADFNSSQDQYTAEHVYVPFSNFKNQLTIGLTSGDLPDLVIIDNPDMASYVSMGLFRDITEEIKDINSDDYFPGPWASTMLDGKNYGIPFATNCLALFYNKDMFAEQGITDPPTTWDELLEIAPKLSDEAKGITGIGFAAINTEEGTFQCMPWLYAAGATATDVNNEGGIETYTFLQQLVETGSLSKESLNWAQTDVNNQFMARKLAMQLNGPWQLPIIEQEAPDLNYGVALIPAKKTSSSGLGGENLGIVNGKNPEGALAFLKYYNQEEVMIKAMKKYGSFPPRVAAAQDAFWTDDPIQKVFIEQLETAVPRGPSPVWPELSTVLSTSFQEAITLSKTPEDIAKDTQAKLDAIEQ